MAKKGDVKKTTTITKTVKPTTAKTAKAVTMDVPKKKAKATGVLPGMSGAEPKRRGRKVGTLGFRWVKDHKPEDWPSKLEQNIILAMKKVGNGTSGDVMMVAEKTGLNEDLTRQDHNKVVTHVLGKLLKVGIIARTDTKPVTEKKAKPVAKKPVAKKKVAFTLAPAAADVPAEA